MGFEIINKIKKERGLTNAQISQMSGVTLSTLDKITSGANTNPKLDTLQAICKVLGCTLNDFDDSTQKKKSKTIGLDFGNTSMAQNYSNAALQLARDYDGLDTWGKKAVRSVADTEMARCADEARFRDEVEAPASPRQINRFLEPSAAGVPSPVEGRDYEVIDLGPDDPQGAAYAVRLQGDSMAPDFPDGCTVFVNHDALADGDIGIFSVDGGTVCKQYHRDPLGMVYLFSLNRKRQDADIVIPPSSNQTLVCQGRVMTKKHYPVPGMW